MADWASLKPLKVHSTFMTIVVIGLTTFLIVTPRHFLKSTRVPSSIQNEKPTSYVIARNGLSIREQPNLNGKVLTTAPMNEQLTILDDHAAEDVVGGTSGRWYKVQYRDITGYAWGNYISK